MSSTKKVKPIQKEKKVKSKGAKKSGKSSSLPSKIIIRHLPPNLTSEQFLNKISPVPDYSYYYFVEADTNLGEFSYSRAYIEFVSQDDILIFKEKFDNFIFLDDKGNEYTAIVEFALYQGTPKNKNKNDLKVKKIENDTSYLNFVKNLENINKEEFNLPSVENCLEEIEAKAKELKNDNNMMTPLLEYLKEIEIEKKSKDFASDVSKKNSSEDKRNTYFKRKTKSKKWQNESSHRSVEKDTRRKFKRIEKETTDKKSFKSPSDKKNYCHSSKNDTVFNIKVLPSVNSHKNSEKEFNVSPYSNKNTEKEFTQKSLLFSKKETMNKKPDL